jgi:N-dimethylarginine dimethylaminohydrolase
VTIVAPSPRATSRVPTARRYLMCPPEHFEVSYAINPWMDPTRPVDRALALHQWEALRGTYERLGHTVEVIDPVPGLPDMVFAANGGLVYGGRALGARFTYPQRAAEAPAYLARLRAAGLDLVAEPTHVNEGEGDFVVVGDRVLAGTGYRTDPGAHDEAQAVLGVEVLGLELVDPRYYHLDTCLAALDDANVAYYPPAFSAAGRTLLETLYPDAVRAEQADAEVLGLNFVSDGRHVVISQDARGLIGQLADAGYEPVPVDLSELLKAGGSVKCCTMELRGSAATELRGSAATALRGSML